MKPSKLMPDSDNFSVETTLNVSERNFHEIPPLITRERTQKFELLLHLIPNLKQHLVVYGVSGIGKTVLLDMLYDIDSDKWQCCFVQGTEELSFETIEAQLTKTMLRYKHGSLESAFQDFQEQRKKIVLIIDDAGSLVSGLMTTLVDYAASQSALKLIFSMTPETYQNSCRVERVLENFHLLEMPKLTKLQCEYFINHLAQKPRTYTTFKRLDEPSLDKLYRETQGVPARIIDAFSKLSRTKQHDHIKWISIGAGLMVLSVAINQSMHHAKLNSVAQSQAVDDSKNTVLVPHTIDRNTQKMIAPELGTKNDLELVPAIKIDIPEDAAMLTVEVPNVPVDAVEQHVTDSHSDIAAEHDEPSLNQVQNMHSDEASVSDTSVHPDEDPQITQKIDNSTAVPARTANEVPTSVENDRESAAASSSVAPVSSDVNVPVVPKVTFPSVEPSKSIKIHPLADKTKAAITPLAVLPMAPIMPEIKPINSAEEKMAPKKDQNKSDEKSTELKSDAAPKIEIPMQKKNNAVVTNSDTHSDNEHFESTPKSVISKIVPSEESDDDLISSPPVSHTSNKMDKTTPHAEKKLGVTAEKKVKLTNPEKQIKTAEIKKSSPAAPVNIAPVKTAQVKAKPLPQTESKPTVATQPHVQQGTVPLSKTNVGNYTLQLITLSSSEGMDNFQKKYPALNKSFRVVQSLNSEGQARYGLMYGGFASIEDANKAKQSLPAEFSNALPRKITP
jgi:hypothetical protein